MILALDPSGNFHEGKGITGWCLIKEDIRKIIKFGAIDASTSYNDSDHWRKHVDLVLNLHEANPDLVVIIEDFMLYASQAANQINSRFETVKLIGIIQYICDQHNIPYHMQTATSVKRRWKDFLLEEKGYIKQETMYRTVAGEKVPYKNTYVNGVKVNDHVVDSIRHGVHYLTFRVEKEISE